MRWSVTNFWIAVLEKTLESPLDCKEIQPVHSKGDQSWVFIGRTDIEAETPILWPPNAKSWLIWKDPDAGKDWGREEKGTTKDEMVGWHHRLNGHGFVWTLGVGDGQGGLACCGSWSHKESDTTERLNWTKLLELPNPTSNADKGIEQQELPFCCWKCKMVQPLRKRFRHFHIRLNILLQYDPALYLLFTQSPCKTCM